MGLPRVQLMLNFTAGHLRLTDLSLLRPFYDINNCNGFSFEADYEAMKIFNITTKSLCLSCMLIGLFTQSASAQLLKEINKGLREVNNTTREVKKLTNSFKKETKPSSNKPSKVNAGSSDTLRNKTQGRTITRTPTRNSTRQAKEIEPEFVPECLSGDCDNGFGKMQFEKEIYEGYFKNGLCDGKGMTVLNSGTIFKGDFYKGKLHGNITRTDPDGTVFKGAYVDGAISGLGVRTRDGLAVLAYFNRYMEQDYHRQLTMNQLKYHQDTTYARFNKCNCLTRQDFSLPTVEWVDVKYNVFNGYGVKTGERTESDLELSSIKVQGYVNNTDHNIYIRAYRKHYFEERNAYEFIDDSYVVKPGNEVMGNYRRKPSASLRDYFAENYVFLGQYCGKEVTPCNPTTKRR